MVRKTGHGARPDRLRIKRIYEAPAAEDGLRLLVDRLWPRGLSKEKAHIDAWLKEVAPSDALRHRFHHDPDLWPEFRKAYARELEQEPALTAARSIIEKLGGSTVTLLYAAKDEEHNNAAALRDWLLARLL
jgi:uncharacterized protein YeaO (DUF488 family)